MSVSVQSAQSLELGIHVTPAAEKRILTYLTEQRVQNLRLSVKKTGCSGFSYVMDYVQAPQSDDLVFPLTSDRVICVEKASYPYLKGITMDYVKQGIHSKFVFQNPNQTGECGCGESFSVEK
jgi:iron-sulfur cluster assembly protein